MMSKLILGVFLFISITISAQDVFGKWKTIDDKTGEAKSIVEIYKRDGQAFGKIVHIIDPSKREELCTKCEGDAKNKPILGFELLKNMKKSGKYYKNGTIFNPEDGKEYKCRLLVTDDPNVLQVRGYIAFFYATQYWERVVE
ncbi:DUF2147 domain-containing protein [Pontimicrobium sp. MEBiC06410]